MDLVYHVYNRGVDHRSICHDQYDYRRFLSLIKAVNSSSPIGSVYRQTGNPHTANRTPPIVSIMAYGLLPNHFHLLLRQLEDGGISKLMQKLLSGYTSYYNYRYERTGSLFEGRFRYVPVTGETQLAYTAAYISANYEVHGLGTAASWPWSSHRQIISGKCDHAYMQTVIRESQARKRQLTEEMNIFSRL